MTGGAHDPFRLWAKIKNTVKLGYHKPSALAKTFDINVIHNNLYIKMSLGPNFSHGFFCVCVIVLTESLKTIRFKTVI